MAKSINERVSAWRDKKARQGGKAITVMLEPETAQTFAELQAEFGLSQAELVAKAIMTLKSVTSKQGPQPDLFTDKQNAPPTLETIQAKINQGQTTGELMEELLQVIEAMADQGMSHRQIAAAINQAGIPTTSGRGQWQKGRVGKLLQK